MYELVNAGKLLVESATGPGVRSRARTADTPVMLSCWGILAVLALALVANAEAQSPAVRSAVFHPDTIGRVPAELTGFPVPYTRTLAFTTDEGTWMSVDVSPDGQRIVFDLLGDLYTLPIGGGRATRITEGPAFDAQPRFSPDGRSIAFVSDRGGSNALWIADAEGHQARVFAPGAHLSPAWSPDGQCLAASKRGQAPARDTEVMLYCRAAGKAGVKLGAGSGAIFSPDGRSVYFVGRWSGQTMVMVYDRIEGRTSAHSAGQRPAISPDGRSLVYAVPYDGQTAFKVQNLATGAERWLALGVAPLNQADPSRDALPGYAFTPDSKALITWTRGKLWRLDVASGKRNSVPFTAEVQLPLGALMQVNGDLYDSVPPRARRIRSARLSPDGGRLVFVALDKLWIQDLPGGPPRRLTAGMADEYAPAWSPDGQYVAYATWGPQGGGIYRVAPGRPAEKLSRAPAYFDRLTYTLDGTRLLALRGPATERLEAVAPTKAERLELIWLPAAGGESTVITPIVRPASATFVGQPFTTRDPSRVYFTEAMTGLVSMRWDGSERRVIAKGTADDMVLSPDGRRLAVLARETIAVLPAPGSGDTPSIDAALTASLGPIRTLSRQGTDGLTWTLDGRTLIYTGGSAWYRYEAARADSLQQTNLLASRSVGGQSITTTTPLPEPVRQEITVPFARDVARGTLVLRGARLLTMRGHEVIERGDLVITDGRITAVGANLPVPAGAHVVDVSGKTILPGYIDLWTTFRPLPGVHAVQPWEFLAHLAYGVTTVREPGPVGPDALDYAERVEAGEMLGPRYLAADTPLAANMAAHDPTAMQVRRHPDGGHRSGPRLVEYSSTTERPARQAVLLAARALQQQVFSTGPVDWTRALTIIQDGFPVYAGTFPVTPLGQDVVHLVARGGVTYVPGLVKNDVGPLPLDRFIAQGRYHDDPKLQRFVPHSVLDRETLERNWTVDEQYLLPSYAADAARIVAAGGRVAVATRGAWPGLAVHWELWTLQAGGLSAHDVLRAGTIMGAEALGVAGDVGSLEPGKLADLQILEGNPLDDLRRITALTYVMKGGRLYDAATLAEVWPRRRMLPTPWWVERDPVRPMTGPNLLPPPLRGS